MYRKRVVVTSIIMTALLVSTAITTSAVDVSEDVLLRTENPSESVTVQAESQNEDIYSQKESPSESVTVQAENPKKDIPLEVESQNDVLLVSSKLSSKNDFIELCTSEKIKVADIIGDYDDYKNLTYSIENANVLQIDSAKQELTAISVGSSKLTIKNVRTNEQVIVTIRVIDEPSEVFVNKANITLGLNESYSLNVSFNKNEDTTRYKFLSSNGRAVSVDENGNIKAIGIGSSAIYVRTFNGKIARCVVKVKNAPTSISLNKTSITLGVGETFDLNSSLPSGEGAYSVKYSGNNPSVASVQSAGGLVTAKKVGTATITATTYNGKKVSCVVTVKNAPTSISLNKTSITLGVGETFDLNSSLPSGQGAYSVKYSGNNSAVADVKASGGLVTAKTVGTATITATTYNGKKVNCVVTVKNAPTEIYLNQTSITLGIGGTFDLNSSLPSGQGAYSVKYSGNNPSVADVKASGGLVTAKSVGTATITATTYNGKKVTCKVTVVKNNSVSTVIGSIVKSGPSWASKTLTTFNAGAKFSQISKTGNWVQVSYNGSVGYIYNRAFVNKANYSTINEANLGVVADDIIFTRGSSISSLYDFVAREVSYTTMANGSSVESMSVYALKYRRGACYYQSSLLYYLLNRAGYDVERVVDGNIYVRGGYHPHTWCIVKTSNGSWRHLDPTGIQEIGKSYMTTDAFMEKYLTWGTRTSSNKHNPYHNAI